WGLGGQRPDNRWTMGLSVWRSPPERQRLISNMARALSGVPMAPVINRRTRVIPADTGRVEPGLSRVPGERRIDPRNKGLEFGHVVPQEFAHRIIGHFTFVGDQPWSELDGRLDRVHLRRVAEAE